MPNFSYPGVPRDQLFDHVVELAQAAEAAGFDLVTVMDHFYQIRGVGPEDRADARGATRRSARSPPATSRVRLGTLVTGVTYRNPALLAKMVTTLDVISQRPGDPGPRRRVERVDEHVGYGFDFPPIARAHGPARRGADDREAHVHGGAAVLRGHALPDRPGAQRAAARSSPAGRRS